MYTHIKKETMTKSDKSEERKSRQEYLNDKKKNENIKCISY